MLVSKKTQIIYGELITAIKTNVYECVTFLNCPYQNVETV